MRDRFHGLHRIADVEAYHERHRREAHPERQAYTFHDDCDECLAIEARLLDMRWLADLPAEVHA